jgi:hypothetical protein
LQAGFLKCLIWCELCEYIFYIYRNMTDFYSLSNKYSETALTGFGFIYFYFCFMVIVVSHQNY